MDERVAAVVAEARSKDPSLDPDAATELALLALGLPAGLDGPELARRLLAERPDVDVSWANTVATAVAGL